MADHDLLVRIDERTHAISSLVASMKEDMVTKQEHKNLKENQDRMVTQEEFKPVKRIAYGIATLTLSAVALALIGSVVQAK